MTLTDLFAGAVLTVFGPGRLGVVVLRPERARVADTHTRRAARPPGNAPHTRVGPGDDAPAPPAPSRRPDRFAHNRVPRRGRADHPGGAT